MSVRLFDTGPPDQIPVDVLRDAYRWAQKTFGGTADTWEATELSAIREHIGAPYLKICEHNLRSQLIDIRKDGELIQHSKQKDLGWRVWKAGRDYARQRAREGWKHSEEYDRYLLSSDWFERIAKHRRACAGRCQLCGRTKHPLEGHHTPEGYSFLGREKDVHLLSLCAACHAVADLLREAGRKMSESERGNGLFDGNGEADWKRISEVFGIDLDDEEG
jgi:hypothetical protein